MATLISYHSSDGDKGRCDSRCYDAYGPDCHCVCQGVNHGKGLEQAKANTDQLAEQWIELCQRDRGLSQDITWKVLGTKVATPK